MGKHKNSIKKSKIKESSIKLDALDNANSITPNKSNMPTTSHQLTSNKKQKTNKYKKTSQPLSTSTSNSSISSNSSSSSISSSDSSSNSDESNCSIMSTDSKETKSEDITITKNLANLLGNTAGIREYQLILRAIPSKAVPINKMAKYKKSSNKDKKRSRK
jgi:hypothetical protein